MTTQEVDGLFSLIGAGLYLTTALQLKAQMQGTSMAALTSAGDGYEAVHGEVRVKSKPLGIV